MTSRAYGVALWGFGGLNCQDAEGSVIEPQMDTDGRPTLSRRPIKGISIYVNLFINRERLRYDGFNYEKSNVEINEVTKASVMKKTAAIIVAITIAIGSASILAASNSSGRDSIENIDYVILLCDDVASMKKFYTEVMGFEVHVELPNWIDLTVGDSLLTLRKRGRPYDGPKNPEISASVQLGFRVPVPAVDQCYEEIQAYDVEIIEAPRNKSWGHRTLMFKDPEGNVVEIFADI